MSKKSWKLVGVVGTVLVVGTLLVGIVAFAQGPQNGSSVTDGSTPTLQSNFVDEDGDGVCDLMGTDGSGMQNGSMNGGHHGDMTGDALNAQDGTGNQYGRNGGSRGHGNK